MASYTYNTFGDVIDEAYDILAVDGDSNTFPGLSRANFNKFANRFNKDFIDSVRLRTQEATSTYTTVADTTLSAAAPSGATSLTITSSTGWPASGLCLVDKIPMTFVRSSLTLTVSAIARDFSSGDTVQLAYAVPSDFWRAQSLFISGQPFAYARRGDEEAVPASHYSLYGDYFVLPQAQSAAQDMNVHYYKKPTAALTSSDTMDIMEMWDYYVIYKLVAHGNSILGDRQRMADYEIMAEQAKKKARSHFARLDASTNNAFIPDF